MINSELGSGEHLLETVQHIRPKVVILKSFTMVVELVKNINNTSTDEYSWIVKIVHKTMKNNPKFSHF